MTHFIHRLAISISFLCITTFFLSTILGELFGSHAAISQIKNLIVFPGLFILIPFMIVSGASGFLLAKSRNGRLIEKKKKRMPFIAANGILVLIPCAILLDRWASAGAFDVAFYTVQIIELIAGATNLVLMNMSIRDGIKISGRYRAVVTANS